MEGSFRRELKAHRTPSYKKPASRLLGRSSFQDRSPINPLKLGLIALGITGLLGGGVWIALKPFPKTEDDLPLLTSEQDTEDFKIAPDGSEDILIPHKDKTFFKELTQGDLEEKPEGILQETEMPEAHISQNDLLNTLPPEDLLESAQEPQGSKQESFQAKKDINSLLAGSSSLQPEGNTKLPALPPTVSESSSLGGVQTVEAERERTDDDLGMFSEAEGEEALDEASEDFSQEVDEILLSMSQKEQKEFNLKGRKGEAISCEAKEHKSSTSGSFSEEKILTPVIPGLEGENKGSPQGPIGPTQENYWLQLASLPTAAAAEQEWQRLQNQYRGELRNHPYRIVRIDLGKRIGIRYRIQCGPLSKMAATKIEQSFERKGVKCLKIKQ